MKKVRVYTDIGHSSDQDLLWIVCGSGMEVVRRITSTNQPEHWTHWKIWGSETNLCWHGRFEDGTGRCSVVPPEGWEHGIPPRQLLDALLERFNVSRFYYFHNGVQSFSPNPKKGGG